MSNTPTVLSTIPSSPSAVPASEPSGAPAEAVAEAPAEATPTESPSTEAPAERQEPDPDLVIAQKLEAVSKREARARKAEATLQSRLTEIDRMKADLAQKLAEAEAALEDPIEWALKRGKDPVEVTKRLVKPMTEEEKRIAKLEAEIEKDRQARREAEERAKAQAKAREQERFWQGFVREITPDEYPHLTSLYQAHEVPNLVVGLLNRPHDPTDSQSPTVRQVFRAQYDRDPTPKEIRDALEHEAETRAMSVIERVKPKTAPSQVTPSTPPAKEESTSLSNHHAASSSSARAGNETREERLKRLKAELEAEAATTE